MICENCKNNFEEHNIIYDELRDIYLCENCYYKLKIKIRASDAKIEEIKETLKKLTNNEVNIEDFLKSITKQYNTFNVNDDFLYEIVLETGRVDYPIYIYGLINRKEFEIRCTRDIFNVLLHMDLIKENTHNNTFLSPEGEVGIIIEEGERRLGISHNLRLNHRTFCIELIKKITNK